MEVWVGGKKIVETISYCEIWGGMGWMVIETYLRHLWLWVLEKHQNDERSFLTVHLF